MCGRYSLTISKADLTTRFPFAAGDPPQVPRYNAAPSQNLPIIMAPEGDPRWSAMTWGFAAVRPARVINARVETLAQRPRFRRWLERARCLAPADGYYEWATIAGASHGKWQPFRFVRRDRAPFAFAALWRPGPRVGAPGEFVILTTRPNELTSAFHDRMPVILRADLETAWLDPDRPLETLITAVAEPPDGREMEAYAVSPRVNRPDFDDPVCIVPVPTPSDSQRTLW